MEANKCSKCEKSFGTPQGLSMHMRWNHSIKGRRIMLAAASKNAERGRASNIKRLAEKKEKPQRRTYQRRKPQQEGIRINFCPVCRCDIRKLELALNFQG